MICNFTHWWSLVSISSPHSLAVCYSILFFLCLANCMKDVLKNLQLLANTHKCRKKSRSFYVMRFLCADQFDWRCRPLSLVSGNHCFSKRGKRFVVTCVIKPFIDYIVYDRAACSVHQGINFFGLQGTRSVFLVEFSLIREEIVPDALLVQSCAISEERTFCFATKTACSEIWNRLLFQ